MLTSRQFEQNTEYIVNKSIETVGCSCITSIRQKHKQRQTNQSLKDKVKKLLLGSVLSDTSKKKKSCLFNFPKDLNFIHLKNEPEYTSVLQVKQQISDLLAQLRKIA